MTTFVTPNFSLEECIIRETWSDAARAAAAAARRSRKRGGGLYHQITNARKAYFQAGGKPRTGIVNRTAKRFPEHADYIKKHGLRFERQAGISKDYFKDSGGRIHVFDLKTKSWSVARLRGTPNLR